MMNYKRPRFWVIILSIVIVAAVGIGLLANPKVKEAEEDVIYAPHTDSSAKIAEENIFAMDSVGISAPKGETKSYIYQGLKIELTNVKSDRTETMIDDGGNEWQYIVITYYPGAKLTVIKADMSNPAYTADGKAYPQWGILKEPDNPVNRIKITDDLQPVEITSDLRGVYNLESSLYVFKFETYSE